VHARFRSCALLFLTGFVAACSNRDSPVAPTTGHSLPQIAQVEQPQTRNERLARRLALALQDRDFRAAVHAEVTGSQLPEGKVHFQRFLTDQGGKQRRRLAELAGEREEAIGSDLFGAAPIEVYLPVRDHRRAWKGEAAILVATATRDGDPPIAFDPRGRRLLLDPITPPKTPVIALVPAEHDFSSAGIPAQVPHEPPGGYGGGGTTSPSTTPGLYLTYAQLTSTFEGWLKGAPEIEVHMLGQDGSSNTLKSYQCAGERAGGPYAFNMDEKEWRGNVLLFSQAQLDGYKASHPSQALRILVLEDDDTPCGIRSDSARVTRMFELIASKYGELTGGRDTLTVVKMFKKAKTLISILKSVWSFFQTKDEIAGTAIEDLVAQEFFPGANWIIKGENTVTHGALKLEMR